MNPHILPVLAFAGLAPFLWAAPQEVTQAAARPQDSAEQDAGSRASGKQEPAKKEAIEPDEAKTVWEYLSGRYDANGDGKIAKDEYSRGTRQFERLDKDKNGFIEEADTEQQGGRGRGGRRGGGQRPAEAPTEGSAAPDFQLETLYPTKATTTPTPEEAGPKGDGKKVPATKRDSKAETPPTYERVKLSSLKGKKPVALIFGSYT